MFSSAPAVVLKELGKIALVGAEATAASGLGTAATASGAATKTAGGVLAGVKAKVVTAAAVAVVGVGGVGGVVTYKHVKLAEQPKPVVRVTKPVADTTPKKTVRPARSEPSAGSPETVTVSRPEEPMIDTDGPTPKPAPDKPVATSSSDGPVAETTSSKAPRAAYGGTYWGRRTSSGRSGTSAEQEDPNDTESKVRRRVSRRRR